MLNISHISKSFNPGTPNEKLVLNDLSLNVEKGDFITIIGANGAGKSTLLNAIAGSFIADSGTITMAGCDITLMPEHIRANAPITPPALIEPRRRGRPPKNGGSSLTT